MFYVYIIQSSVENWNYAGLTGDIEERLERHNGGRERTTRPYRPFNLLFVQIFETRIAARDFEKYLKIRSNKESVLLLIAGVAKLVDAHA